MLSLSLIIFRLEAFNKTFTRIKPTGYIVVQKLWALPLWVSSYMPFQENLPELKICWYCWVLPLPSTDCFTGDMVPTRAGAFTYKLEIFSVIQFSLVEHWTPPSPYFFEIKREGGSYFWCVFHYFRLNLPRRGPRPLIFF